MLFAFRAHLNIDYTGKVQNVRVVASLASVCLINDVAMSLNSCISSLEAGKRPRSPRPHRTSYRTRLPSSLTEELDEFCWVNGVLDKLNDYNRYA